MGEILFKGKNVKTGVWYHGDLVHDSLGSFSREIPLAIKEKGYYPVEVIPETVCQYIGIDDKVNEKYFYGDIGEFDNGDRFFIGQQEWVEFFAEWIGEPECEDQTRDLYRISKSKKIGNRIDNPELLEA